FCVAIFAALPLVSRRIAPKIDVLVGVRSRVTIVSIEQINFAVLIALPQQPVCHQHATATAPHTAFREIAGYSGVADMLDTLMKAVEPFHRGHREATTRSIDGEEIGIDIAKLRHLLLLDHEKLIV